MAGWFHEPSQEFPPWFWELTSAEDAALSERYREYVLEYLVYVHVGEHKRMTMVSQQPPITRSHTPSRRARPAPRPCGWRGAHAQALGKRA